MITVSAKDAQANSIAAHVYDLLWSEQSLRTTTADIEIEAGQGAVALNGRVRTFLMSKRAELLARAAVDGWELHNRLISDDQIAMDLAARMASDARTVAADVRFEVYLGTVFLNGTVDGEQQRAAVLELAGQAPNILKIEDHLVIAR